MFTCITVSPSALSSPIPFLDTRLSLIFIHFAWLLFFSEIILLPFHLCSKFSLCAHSEGVCRKEYKSAQKKKRLEKRGTEETCKNSETSPGGLHPGCCFLTSAFIIFFPGSKVLALTNFQRLYFLDFSFLSSSFS